MYISPFTVLPQRELLRNFIEVHIYSNMAKMWTGYFAYICITNSQSAAHKSFNKILEKFWPNLVTFVASPSDSVPQFAQYWKGCFILWKQLKTASESTTNGINIALRISAPHRIRPNSDKPTELQTDDNSKLFRQIAIKFCMQIKHIRTIFAPQTSSFSAVDSKNLGEYAQLQFLPINPLFINRIPPNLKH